MQPEAMPRQIIGSYPDYAEAERAVDFLSDNRFPVDRVAIIGADLRFVEEVTGRRGYLKAAVSTALSGAAVGALIGWLFGIFSWVAPLISAILLALWGVIIGGIIGAIVGLISHAATRGRRDFSSTSAMRAGRYDVVVEPGAAPEARNLLAGMAGVGNPATASPSGQQPRQDRSAS